MDERVWSRQVADYTPAVVEQAVEELFCALPAARRIGPSTRVLLKPNYLAKHAPEKAVTTHPEVLRAVIRAVKRRGAEQIVVADSAGGPATPVLMRAIYRACGAEEVCRQEGAQLWLGTESGERQAPAGGLVNRFTLMQPVLDADFIIDLPKMKTHMMTGMTGAVKNLFGCVPGLQKAEFHMRFPEKERFGAMIVDLLGTVRPDLVLLDGITAMEGDGPAGGEPRGVGLLLGSESPLQVDLALCGLMGIDPLRVPYLAVAQSRGLCAAGFDPQLWQGDGVYAPIPGWKMPASFQGGSESTDFAETYPAFLQPIIKAGERAVAPRPVIDRAQCIGCGQCAQICPQQVIELRQGGRGKKAFIHPKRCIRCFCCHEVCPIKAIQVRRFGLFRHL